jgi:tetratricopeptide (TPR) repeat protein
MKKMMMLFLLVAILFIQLSVPSEAMTQIPYRTYTEDASGNLILTQDAYIPVGIIPFSNFANIRELQVYNSKIYVLDVHQDESRIHIFNEDFSFKTSLSLPTDVIRPEGFYVTAQFLYIADLGTNDEGRIHVFSINHENDTIVLENVFLKPDTPLFGAETPFLPRKIVVDSRGNLYVISEGALNGVLQMSRTGRFFGFFGANRADVSRLRSAFRSFFPTQRQIVLPPTPTNVAIDEEGFVFTVTEGLSDTGLKKFNVASRNFLPDSLNVIQGNVAVATGNYQNVYTLSKDGIIREYDVEGNMLFSFGGSMIGDNRLGLFRNPVAISVTKDHKILVADSEANNIQIFNYTEFAGYVHRALESYQDSDFDEGIALWNDVLLYNSWFELAYKGIGHAYMSLGDYELAMESYQRTNYVAGYSDAFWELRNIYIENYIGWLVILFFGVQILYVIKRAYNQKGYTVLPKKYHQWNNRFKESLVYLEWTHPFKIIRKPLDTFYDIKRNIRTSTKVSTAIYLLVGVTYFVRLLFTNYIFIGPLENQTIMLNLLMIYGGLFVFLVMNYLVCSIREGSGFFKEVYIGLSYTIFPIILVTLVMTFVSRGLTLNEIFIYQYIHQIVYIWSGFLVYFMIKDIYYYDVGETFLNIGITMFAMVVVIFVGFMGYVIFNQSFNFFQEIIREAILRVQGY